MSNDPTSRRTITRSKGDCRGLKGFFECDLEGKRTTRSSFKGDLPPPTMKNIPSQGYRHQSVTSVDTRNAKMTKLQLRSFPKYNIPNCTLNFIDKDKDIDNN
jgi:hypothetical protein